MIDRMEDGSYALVPRELPLDDAFHVSGEVATGFRGGSIVVGLKSLEAEYREGARMRVQAVEQDGSWVPLDEDGLIAWSFYHHLATARDQLIEQGHDVQPLYPLRFAYQPTFALDFLGVENAAYVAGTGSFVILPDAFEGVPLAANAGVVRHEFGHAWFERLMTAGPVIADEEQNAVGALNEGFADMVGSLLLDDPAFIDPSLPLPDRHLVPEHVATPQKYPTPDQGPLDYDPYVLGSVYASFMWNVRLASSPEEALTLAADAVVTYAGQAVDDGYADTDRFVQAVLDAATGDLHEASCVAAGRQFPDRAFEGCR
ncbi:MAG: hypothetical protein KC621_16460 [Myxococcales bacterium]|nr:hypothetical protein [Myxococcales bacterium]